MVPRREEGGLMRVLKITRKFSVVVVVCVMMFFDVEFIIYLTWMNNFACLQCQPRLFVCFFFFWFSFYFLTNLLL